MKNHWIANKKWPEVEYGTLQSFSGYDDLLEVLRTASDVAYRRYFNSTCSAKNWIGLTLYDVPRSDQGKLGTLMINESSISADQKAVATQLPDLRLGVTLDYMTICKTGEFETTDLHDLAADYTLRNIKGQWCPLRHNMTCITLYLDETDQ